VRRGAKEKEKGAHFNEVLRREARRRHDFRRAYTFLAASFGPYGVGSGFGIVAFSSFFLTLASPDPYGTRAVPRKNVV
jgi:hypothetical protein